MKTKTNSMRFKFSAVFLLGLFAFVLIANAGTITIPASFTNVMQVIQRIFVTTDGTETGSGVMDINTGDDHSVIVYGPLLDGEGNPYITGAVLTESDPLWNAVSGDYVTTTQLGAVGYLTDESDPLWNAVSGNYSTTTQINAM